MTPSPRQSIQELMALAMFIRTPRPATATTPAPARTVPGRQSRFVTVDRTAAPDGTSAGARTDGASLEYAAALNGHGPQGDHRAPLSGLPLLEPAVDRASVESTGRDRDAIVAAPFERLTSSTLEFLDTTPVARPEMPPPDATVEEVQSAGRRTLEWLAGNGALVFDPTLEETDRLYPKGPTAASVEELPFSREPDPKHPVSPLTAQTATLKADIGDNVVFLATEPGTGAHPTLHALLTHMETLQATDLHLQIGEPPTMRIQGVIKRLDMQPLEPEHMRSILYAVCTEEDIARLEEKSKRADRDFFAQSSDVLADHDLTYSFAGTRYRTNVAIENRGTMVVMRRLKNDPPALQDLRLPKAAHQIVHASSGLVLITGATSAGKTTTMASFVGMLAREVQANIITVEDPVEYQYTTGLRSIVKQRQVGRDTHSFAAGVKAALRQDPDVIVVGELLDATTAELALAAAQTGHLVFATMHAGSAVEVPARIINFFPADQRAVVAAQLSGVLQLFTYQVLLPRAAGGLVPAFAVTPITPALQANIADMGFTELPRSVEAAAREGGGCTLLDSVSALIHANIVTVGDAAATLNKEDREQLRRSMR
jgi:twitching motility protein PilT